MRKLSLFLGFVLSALCAFASPYKVQGVVRDGSGRPVSGVRVTDGFSFVKTNNSGFYEIEPHDNAKFVYLSLPSGFETKTKNGAPLFYKEIIREQSLQKCDFDIFRTSDDSHHQFVVMADVQVYRECEIDLVKKAVSDVKNHISEAGLPTFGMHCGDMVGKWDSGFSVNIQKCLAASGFPFYTLMGNHDYKSGVATNEESKLFYTEKFGPTYYSFNKGGIHYVVLDDVFYFSRHYIGYLEQSQLDWLKKDLAECPKGSTVVVFMHIPSYSREARAGQTSKEANNKILTNRKALYEILSPFQAHICVGHEHYAENYIIKDNIFEHVHSPLSGLFWQSLYACDGTPWGYYVYEAKDGKLVNWHYKPVGESSDKQFSAYRVGEDPLKPHSVVANVWNYDPAWTVEWRENGVNQGPMTQYAGWDKTIVADVDNRREKEFTWQYIGAGQTEHIFYATPSSVDSFIEIIVTDRFGKQYNWSSENTSIYSTSSYNLDFEGVFEDSNNYTVHSVNTYPEYGSFYGANKMETQLYNLSIDEMVKNMESDGTFRTGEYWGGVWTRDVSYSAILSLAHLAPEVVKTSLLKKVDKKGRIIQDTGTGGSWPCSTDRVVWAIAAYEVFLETGDMSWLRHVYPIIKRSLETDLRMVYNPESGLFRGESSFIDWREQSYPKWMQPTDIAASECLGTNAVFYRALEIASIMASKLGPTRISDSKKYAALASELKTAINEHFWMEDKGYYAQYIYGRNARYLSPRAETLGQSLCILWGIASLKQAQSIMENMPVCDFGPTIFNPQISSMGSYHNDAIWPFVTSFYGMAAAKVGNTASLMHALGSNMRAALVFGSNMENMVASTGTKATALNSPRQLWSVAGFSGLFRNTLLGINYELEGIRFNPIVPQSMIACRKLENLKYRDMILDIEVIGEGKIIKECRIDDKTVDRAFVPATLSGHHKVTILMTSDYYAPKDSIRILPVEWDLDYPKLRCSESILSWEPVKGADSYRIYKDGAVVDSTSGLNYKPKEPGEYTVVAFSQSGRYSFISEPINYSLEQRVYSADIMLDSKLGLQYRLELNITKSGTYRIDFEYSNGNGDITTYNKCATRSLYIDRTYKGPIVMPQRGDSWDDKGYTQPITISLEKGNHTIDIKFEDDNRNMNIDTDNAMLRNIRLTYVE